MERKNKQNNFISNVKFGSLPPQKMMYMK